MSVGESLGSHSLHSFAEFLQSHINSPEASSCLTSRRKSLHVLKPFTLTFMATENQLERVANSTVRIRPRICHQICMRCTRLTLKKPMVNAKLESNGFEDIGLKSGTSTDFSRLSMLRRMPSSSPGETYYTKSLQP